MPGVRALRKLQLGLEATKGTSVPATTIWRGRGMPEDRREVVFVEEDIGLLSGADRTYVPALAAALAMEETPVTFEQLPYILSAGLENIVAGAADGVGSGKIYTYNFATTTPLAIKTYTIEAGDDAGVEEMEYSFVEGFKINGRRKEAWQVSADWLARQLVPSTFTAALATPAVVDALFGGSKLYVNDVAGGFGGTLISNTLLGAELSVKTGRAAIFTGDNLFFTLDKQVMPEALLAITFEHETQSIAEKAKWRAETARALRILIEGPALATPGTTYSKKTVRINLSGKWESFDKIDEEDGNDIIKATFRMRYNSTLAVAGSIVVVNELASLP